MSTINPLSVPTKLPIVTTQVVNTRTNVSAPVNDPDWLKWFQNVSEILQDSVLTSALGTAILAFQAPGPDWLACNGAAVSRTTYSDLFTLIGTTFGAGDGSTTFNLPTIPSATTGLTWFMEAVL